MEATANLSDQFVVGVGGTGTVCRVELPSSKMVVVKLIIRARAQEAKVAVARRLRSMERSAVSRCSSSYRGHARMRVSAATMAATMGASMRPTPARASAAAALAASPSSSPSLTVIVSSHHRKS